MIKNWKEFCDKVIKLDPKVEAEKKILTKIQEKAGLETDERCSIRKCEAIVLPDGRWLSVQASHYHYCEPRFTIPFEDYKAVEVALFTPKKKPTKWETHPLLEEYFDGSVHSHVPVDVVVAVYNDLMNPTGLEELMDY